MFVCSFKNLLISKQMYQYFFQTVIMSIQRKMQLMPDYCYCAWILVSTPFTKAVINNPVYF